MRQFVRAEGHNTTCGVRHGAILSDGRKPTAQHTFDLATDRTGFVFTDEIEASYFFDHICGRG